MTITEIKKEFEGKSFDLDDERCDLCTTKNSFTPQKRMVIEVSDALSAIDQIKKKILAEIDEAIQDIKGVPYVSAERVLTELKSKIESK